MSNVVQSFNNLSYSKEIGEDGLTRLNITIENKRFDEILDKVYKKFAPTVEVPGFRAGNAPRNIVIAKLGARFYEEALKDLMPSCTYEVISREKITPLSQISYEVKKMAEGSGVDYVASFIAFPEFNLPNFKKIKVKKEKTEVKDEDTEKVLKQMAEEKQKKDKDFKINDAWAKSLNLGAKNLVELKIKIKGEIEKQKESLNQNKYLLDIIDRVAEQSKLSIPKALVDADLNMREKEYKERITKLGMKVEDFLRNQKTTIEELKKGWVKESEDKLKAEIVLLKVAKEYDLKVGDEELEDQISKIKDEKLKSQYENAEGRNYLQSILLRQKIVKKIFDLVDGKES